METKKPIPVKDLNHLCQLALEGRSVVMPNGLGRSPAAFVQNMQGSRINLLLKSGMTVYEARKSQRPKWASRNQIPFEGSVVEE